jgi:hypothetical protein
LKTILAQRTIGLKEAMRGSSKASRLLKKSAQQGRSERGGEACFVLHVEPLSDARTMLAGFFNNLLDTNKG